MKNHTKKIHSLITAGLVLGALVLGPVGALLAQASPSPVNITVVKIVDGMHATAAMTNNANFIMNSNWNDPTIGSGSSQYALGPTGINTAAAYEASVSNLHVGANYSTSEVLDGLVVGPTCYDPSVPTPHYGLIGYSTGDTLSDAMASSATTTAPSFTNIASDKFVVVWNQTCPTSGGNSTAKVHVQGYVDGAAATAITAGSYQFPISETYQASNQNGGSQVSDSFVLGNNADPANLYEYDSVDLATPASYSLSADVGGSTNVVSDSAQCTPGKFALEGYKVSDVSFADAANQTLTTTAPDFQNVSGDKYVIVLDATCGTGTTTNTGTIGGTVTGGTTANGTLSVTSVTPMNTVATADGTFTNGWKYMFHVTVPDNETHLSMKFDDWTNTAFSSFKMPVASNMRISSSQASNSGTVMITAANAYSSPALTITGDLDANAPGKQIDVLVEAAIPSTTVNGSYTTNYSLQTVQ